MTDEAIIEAMARAAHQAVVNEEISDERWEHFKIEHKTSWEHIDIPMMRAALDVAKKLLGVV